MPPSERPAATLNILLAKAICSWCARSLAVETELPSTPVRVRFVQLADSGTVGSGTARNSTAVLERDSRDRAELVSRSLYEGICW